MNVVNLIHSKVSRFLGNQSLQVPAAGHLKLAWLRCAAIAQRGYVVIQRWVYVGF